MIKINDQDIQLLQSQKLNDFIQKTLIQMTTITSQIQDSYSKSEQNKNGNNANNRMTL